VLIGVFKIQSKYEVTLVHGIREGKIVWSRQEILLMITLGREKLMQHMLLGIHEVSEQCVVAVRDELSCRWPVSRLNITIISLDFYRLRIGLFAFAQCCMWSSSAHRECSLAAGVMTYVSSPYLQS